MGADLYIEKLEGENQHLGFEVSREAVKKGYFRDCYNPFGLFYFIRNNTNLNLSWWELQRKKEWFTKDGKMKVNKVKEFLDLILEAKNQIDKKGSFIVQTYDYENNEEIVRYMRKEEIKEHKDWLDFLIEFLQIAIKLKSRILWSV